MFDTGQAHKAENYQQSIQRFQRDVKSIMESDEAPSTPCVFFDLDRLDQQIELWREEMPGIEPHFAIKACDAVGILQHMHRRGISFDAATGGELDLLSRLGIEGSKIVMTHPIRSDEDLDAIRRCRPMAIVVQSADEVIKLAEAGIPNSDYSPVLLARVALPYSNLNKFGVPCIVPLVGEDGRATTAFDYRPLRRIFETARSIEQQFSVRFQAYGFAGHVGTNTTSASHYLHLLGTFRVLGLELKRRSGIPITLFDLGGGYCDRMHAERDGITQRDLLNVINQAVEKFRSEYGEPVTIIAEPGRYLVADTAIAVTRAKVVTDAHFGAINGAEVYEMHKVIHLDDGVYSNLMGQIHDSRKYRPIPFRLRSSVEISGTPVPCVMWGPTCDSFDRVIPPDDYRVPQGLVTNDLFMIECMGAYTTVTATEFNRTQASKVVLFSRTEQKIEATVYTPRGEVVSRFKVPNDKVSSN